MNGLPAHTKGVRDLLPGPAERARVLHLELLEGVVEDAEGAKPDRWVPAVGGVRERLKLGHLLSSFLDERGAVKVS
jgi:hypothetical protein